MKRLTTIVGAFVVMLVIAWSPTASMGAGADAKEAFIKENILLLAMHADLLEGIEEAFAYQLLNDTKERDEFFAKMKDFDALAGKVKTFIKDKALLAELGKLIDAKGAMVKAGEAMFKKFEADKKPDMALVKAFESKVDALTKLFDKFDDDLDAKAMKAGLITDEVAETRWHVHRMHADALEGIEEAMSYPLLGDAAEKKDFFNKMKEFDKYAKHLATDPDHLKYDKKKLELLKKAVAAKAKLQTAAETMFKDYESKKAAVPADVMKFEAVVDEFTGVFDKLSDALIKDIIK